MTLNYQAIEQAVNAERDAGGFAKLMQDFQELGVLRYDYLVATGIYRYFDADSHVDLKMNGVPKPVASVGDASAIKAAVKGAQAGEFDFERFCELAGAAGVPVWTSDLTAKEVRYYDENGQVLLAEPIPGL
ncbi:DUF1398 family protein [Furfurilactobacillus siliginis]|uniref:Phage envelope protein n=1 Tax=Furfurilactobacillus siliginis TaxID=348151 RepID=A0A0R2L9M7_9LACO|nr:DUF1398 family protein [Furfurilactobacillus siliginis]KRN96044.1 Phage envelope protein [Furfurilactobacillus siliginis]GEK28750.1 hypothetical protein LSI01_10610 [Furfurilactobacillus siliginis]